jgi:two-component system LytT family response regulator
MKQIIVKVGRSFFFVKVDDIDCIESERNYLRIYKGDNSYLIRNTLGDMEKKLDADKFIRINRSTMVNINCIKELRSQSNSSYLVISNNNRSWTWGRRFRGNLKRILSG